MTYLEFISSLYQLTAITDPDGIVAMNTLLPRIIEATELRMLREPTLDFLATRTSDATQQTRTGFRDVPIPPQFVVVEGAAMITPAGKAPSVGQRLPMLRATRQYIDMIWPTESQTQAPTPLSEIYFAIFNEEDSAGADPDEPGNFPSSIIIAPTPDNQYAVEFTGTQRPEPLSEQTTTNFLSVFLPDLYLASAMIFVSGGILRNYGMQADDPKMAVSWMSVYKDLLVGAGIEELRKKSSVEGFLPYPPNPTTPNVAALQQMAQAAA